MTPEITETFAELGIPVNPFPGLRPFDFDESHLFFGRDGQSEQLISKLSRTHFLAVVGTSGSGKSSLVRAGLMPALLGGFMSSAGSNWRIAITRPGNDPIGNLARALNAPDVFGSEVAENAALQTALAEATLQRGSRGLVDAVRQAVISEQDNVLVIVDQFEELFRFARVTDDKKYGNEAAAFVKLLLEAARQHELPIYVVLTMRSDYLGDCSQFWGLPEAINESQYLIPRLTRDQLREAMTGPISVAHGEITPRLVARLLNDVGDDQDQLPVLQHLLMRVWDEAKEKRLDIETEENGEPVRISHKQVHRGNALDVCCCDAVGGMANALSRHADEAFNELPNDRSRQVAESIFKALTEKGTDNREIRRPVTLGELCAVVDGSENEIITVIETFRRPGRSFLMPPAGVALNSKSLIDISHESLIRGWSRLKAWVDEEARSSRIYQRVAETAVLHSEGGAGLWRDPDLQIALTWRDRSKPNETWARRYNSQFGLAMAFLNESVAERDAERTRKEKERKNQIRRTQLTAIVMAIGCLAATIAGAIAWNAKRDADAQKQIALAATAEAVRLRDGAIVLKNEADRQKGIAEGNLVEVNNQKAITDKALEEARQQKSAAEKNLAEANRQRSVAQVALQQQTTEVLKGKGLSALKEGDDRKAIASFDDLHQHAQKTKDTSADIFAQISTADIYRDRVPFFLVVSESDLDPSELEEGESGAAIKQYLQSYLVAMKQQSKDEEAMKQDMRNNIKLATEKYQLALAANNNHKGPEHAVRQGYILQNLGDLLLVGGASELQEDSKAWQGEPALEARRKEAVERTMNYYVQARQAYHDAALYREEAEILKKTAGLLHREWKDSQIKTSGDGLPRKQEGPASGFPNELAQVVKLYEDAGVYFEKANKPLRQAAMYLLIAETFKELPKQNIAHRNAIRYLQLAADIHRKQKNFLKVAAIDEDLANIYKDFDAELQFAVLKDALTAQRSISIANKPKAYREDIERRVTALVDKIGELLHESGDETAVNKFFTETLNGSSGLERANLLSAFAQFYKQHGENEAAVQYLNQKRDVYKQLGNRIEEANTLFEIGTLHNESNQSVKAGKAFDEAFVSYRDSGDQFKEYQSSYQVGANLLKIAEHFAASDKQKAIGVYEETMRLSIGTPSLLYNISSVMQALGPLYLEMKTEEGNAKARKLFQTTIDTSAARKSDNEAEVRSIIGDVYKKVGDKANARASYDLALNLYDKKEFGSYRYAEVLRKIGALEIEGTPKTLADFYVQESIAAGDTGNVRYQAVTTELTGYFYRESGDAAKAMLYLERAALLYHQADLKTREANILRTLALMYDTKGDKQKARDLRRQADLLDPAPTTYR